MLMTQPHHGGGELVIDGQRIAVGSEPNARQ